MAFPPEPQSAAACPICGKTVALPHVEGLPSDLAFKLLRMAVEWHLNTVCEEAFGVMFGRSPLGGLKAKR